MPQNKLLWQAAINRAINSKKQTPAKKTAHAKPRPSAVQEGSTTEAEKCNREKSLPVNANAGKLSTVQLVEPVKPIDSNVGEPPHGVTTAHQETATPKRSNSETEVLDLTANDDDTLVISVKKKIRSSKEANDSATTVHRAAAKSSSTAPTSLIKDTYTEPPHSNSGSTVADGCNKEQSPSSPIDVNVAEPRIEVLDLTADDDNDDLPDIFLKLKTHSLREANDGSTFAQAVQCTATKPSFKSASTPMKRSTSTPPTSPIEKITNPTTPPPTLPTPDATPPEKSALAHIPEIADRYVPRTSTAEGIDYTNLRLFCLKPPFWRRWSSKTYLDFAETLRLQFDPIPFAREHCMPVEEVRAVFSALVCNPLYDAKEARRRGEDGVEEMMALYNRFGTPRRPWGGKVWGELDGVEKGVVRLVCADGSKGQVGVGELSELDVKYLQDTLAENDASMLWGDRRPGRERSRVGWRG